MAHLSKFLRLQKLRLQRKLNSELEFGVDQEGMIYVKPRPKKKA